MLKYTFSTNYGSPDFTFTSTGIGDAFADFLLGTPLSGVSSQAQTVIGPYIYNKYQG